MVYNIGDILVRKNDQVRIIKMEVVEVKPNIRLKVLDGGNSGMRDFIVFGKDYIDTYYISELLVKMNKVLDLL